MSYCFVGSAHGCGKNLTFSLLKNGKTALISQCKKVFYELERNRDAVESPDLFDYSSWGNSG